jgi:tetratricopeptide (TPR) repeat protein
MTRVLSVLLLLAVGVASAASAPSPLVAELNHFSVRYHEDPPRLDKLREGLERAAASDPHVENLLAVALISYMWGDVRARTRDEKLTAYDHGRQAARRAIETEPRNVAAHFWLATNTARWGQTNGVVRSLSLLPEVQREIRTVLDIDPHFTPVYALAGNVYYEVPGLLGGDLAKAEAMFRTGLAQDPHYTLMRVGLGKTLIKRGRRDEARRELTAVLEERAPRNPADWTLKDAPEARKLLETLRGGS